MDRNRRLYTRGFFMTIVIIINFLGSIKSVTSIDLPCEFDSDCTPGQYCYKISNRCVNYTKCARYNREEGMQPAQSASQCGPCLSGYMVEQLATNEWATLCTKNITSNPGENNYFSSNKTIIWLSVMGAIAVCIFVGLLVFFSRKQVSLRGNKKWFRHMRGWNFSPTAPLPDNNAIYARTTYYNDEPPIYSSVINNNQNVKDKNRLVAAVPYHAPDWVQTDPNYGHDDPDTSVTTPVLGNLHDDDETNPSTWTPEEVQVQLPARAFHQFATEQRDNVLNTVLVRGDCASNSEPTEETATGPSPGATGNSRSSNESYRGPNVQINQMITLNMVNSEN